jgi:release factor glutamine methyltransferase
MLTNWRRCRMNKVSVSQAIEHAMLLIDRLDAQLLLAHVLSKPREYLITWPERELSSEQLINYEALVQRRAQGYPLAYVTGTKSFWNMELIVTPDVLIPRPDTELLVELALPKLFPGARVLELATGSGAIACALARERSDINIIATDISAEALKIARLNAQKYNLNNIKFILSDWFISLHDQPFDLIIANPPYLAETDLHLSTDIRFEPRGALVSGKNGDEDYIEIIAQASNYLKTGAWILLEHGADQGPCVRALLAKQGYVHVFTENDLAGLERVTGGRIR